MRPAPLLYTCRRFALATLLLCCAWAESSAQTAPDPTAAQLAHSYTATRHEQLLAKLADFLNLPHAAADPSGTRAGADYLLRELRARGVSASLLSAPELPETVPPIVYGELRVAGATHTIVFYGHYDGRPAAGRPAIYAQLTALSALQAGAAAGTFTAAAPGGSRIKANLRFLWEGEEETGSTHLESILNAHRDLIGGDVLVISDRPSVRARMQLQQCVQGKRGKTVLSPAISDPVGGKNDGVEDARLSGLWEGIETMATLMANDR